MGVQKQASTSNFGGFEQILGRILFPSSESVCSEVHRELKGTPQNQCVIYVILRFYPCDLGEFV